ncbi:MAG: NAD-dependent epimerase/dehydratase family protein [Maricaulaceae bacterium]
MSAPGLALTGGTGFYGRAIAQALVGSGWRVKALARRPNAAPAGVEVVHGDLRDPRALERLCAGVSAVVHCAGLVKALSRAEFFAVNAQAAGALAEIAARAGANRFVLISSLAARAPHLSDYAASKAEGERVVRATFGASGLVVLRPPAIYGPGDSEIPKLLGAARWGVIPAVSGRAGRVSLIHVADAARAVLAALEADAVAEPIELDDGRSGGYAWTDIARVLGESLGRPVRAVPLPAGLLTGLGRLSGALAAMRRRATIFTAGKAAELGHADWVARAETQAAIGPWRPSIDLAAGLETLTGVAGEGR